MQQYDRKGSEFSDAWLGPYILTAMSPTGVVTLSNQHDCALKTKCNKPQLKPYTFLFDDKPANKDKTYELGINDSDDQMGKLVNKWDALPNDIVDLLDIVEQIKINDVTRIQKED